MQVNDIHLTYCSNIHPGESWQEHFSELRNHLPAIKKAVIPQGKMGLGLRLSKRAATELAQPLVLDEFKKWISEEELYIFTLNGFPYGDFHSKRVKDQVHFPDWGTQERLDYTTQLFEILSELLPSGIEGGISTSPLSYKFWDHKHEVSHREQCTTHILKIADFLSQTESSRGQYMHLDIEPEPDGLLENFEEFLGWYTDELLPLGEQYFYKKYGASVSEAHSIIKRHICLCYDICHFALAYQDHATCIKRLKKENIAIGKIQVSSALKVRLEGDLEARNHSLQMLGEFDEPIYLHQVIVQRNDGSLEKFRDLPEFLDRPIHPQEREWRSHFHVPIFLADYGSLLSTQNDVLDVIALHNRTPLSKHIEVETYTWNVLPKALQLPIQDSIIREIHWLLDQIKE